MPPDRWSRIEVIFRGAVELEGEARTAYLDTACAGDEALKTEVRSLLDHDQPEGDQSIEAAVHGAVALGSEMASTEAVAFAGPGERVGPYRIQQEIGRGGMGAVYRAVRADDQFQMEVAIKVMRRRPGRPDLLQRFQTERQILATLEHPNIARMLDGGTTGAGEPYVVMEYVRGQSLDAYCNQRRLGTRERLAIFRQVCAAVQYAHSNLVVHRDLKPGNILVTVEGVVKLLDFGIAKLLNPDFSPVEPAETATEYRILTPEYAAPEQLKGAAITTATDVYGLGVVLYELLAGRRPYRLKRATTGELERAIVEQEPERPSTAITREETSAPESATREDAEAIGRARSTTPERLSRQLRGDLDNIILMALSKEPGGRYPSPEALSEDIRHHMEGLPVSARAATWRYRTRKFVRRNAAAVAATVAVLAIIVGLVGFYTIRLRQERDRAQAAEQKARAEAKISAATSDFLKNLFAVADPRQPGTRNMNAEDLLNAGVERLRTDESVALETRADLHLTLGLALANLGKTGKAIETLRLSVEEREKAYGRESLETAEGLHRLGDVLRQADQYDESLASLREALAIRERLLPGDSYEMADSYNNLALIEISLGNYAESERLQTAAVEMHARLTGPDSQEISVSLNNLAILETRQGRLDEAEALARRALAIQVRGTDRSSTLLTRHLLAIIRLHKGEPEAALADFRSIFAEQSELIGPRNPRTLVTARNIGLCLTAMGDLPGARRHLLAVLADVEATQGARSRSYAAIQSDLAEMDRMEGHEKQAEAALREVVQKYTEGVGPRHFALPGRKRELAEALFDEGKLDEAESILRESLDLLPPVEEYPHIERARILIRLAGVLAKTGRIAEASEDLGRAAKIIGLTSGERSLEMGLLLLQRGAIASEGGDPGAAREDLRNAGAILPRFLPSIHPDRRTLSALARRLPR